MRRVIVVQARMTSTRLPGKVLADVSGRPMLAQQLRRLAGCRLADELVVATTVIRRPVVAVAGGEGALVPRQRDGSSSDTSAPPARPGPTSSCLPPTPADRS
jgi:CMP-2-keto-3-deoxyoctulosonic acid synthetase